MGRIRQPARRFVDRRDDVIDAATILLNREGAQGLRLADVAGEVGLDTSSLGYYFQKKDALVAACLERSIDWLDRSVESAAALGDERARAAALIEAQFAMFAQQSSGGGQLALLSDMPSLADEARRPLEGHLDKALRTIAEFFPVARPGRSRADQLLASNILSSNIFWLPAWRSNYATRDFPRVSRNLVELFDQGFVTAEPELSAIQPHELEGDPSDAKVRFLAAATKLINRFGHKGARVDRIAAELGLSSGSFYHHLKTKSELVVACFEASFDIFERAFDHARAEPTNGGALANVTASIGMYQLAAEAPLLRIGSYQILPGELRQQMFTRSTQLVHRVAGMISDGIADGSVRHCDPQIAAHYYLAAVYGFSDLREWSASEDAPRLVGKLLRTLGQGAI